MFEPQNIVQYKIYVHPTHPLGRKLPIPHISQDFSLLLYLLSTATMDNNNTAAAQGEVEEDNGSIRATTAGQKRKKKTPEELLNEKIENNRFKIEVLNQKIDGVEEKLIAKIEGVERKDRKERTAFIEAILL